MHDPIAQEILDLNHQLLDAIARGDWLTYQALCDPKLTAFEPEAHGQLVEGLQFHYFYFDLEKQPPKHQTTMLNPYVRVMGDVALLAYVRINQRVNADGAPSSGLFAETRVWERRDGQWRHVHFHRTAVA